MLYTIMFLVFFTFYLNFFVFVCEKFGSERTQSLPASQCFSSFLSSSEFLSLRLCANGIFPALT